MTASELRVGNYLQNKGKWFQVTGQIIEQLSRGVNHPLQNIQPILLTPEILERCGFQNRSQSSDYCFRNGDFMVGGTAKRLFPSVWGESGLEAFGNELKYLHQLQNLYFALTGSELEIKELTYA